MGRAEPIRLLLTLSNIPFEDVRYAAGIEELKKAGHLEFGQVPAVEVDGKWFVQSRAALRLLGQWYGYYPKDAEGVYQVESFMDAIEDLGQKTQLLQWTTKDDEDFQKKYGEAASTTIPQFFKYFENRLKSNTSHEFVYGTKWTLADISLLNFFVSHAHTDKVKGFYEPIIGNYPLLKTFVEKRSAELKKYLDSRKPTKF